MVVQPHWSGLEVRALRDALRETRSSFAEFTGLKLDTIRKWERRGSTVTLRPEHAAIMDTALARATQHQLQLFEIHCAELRVHPNGNRASATSPKLDTDETPRSPLRPVPELTEIDDMKRRQLLRLLSTFTSALAASTATRVDWSRVAHAEKTGTIDPATVAQYATINRSLWQQYTETMTKAKMFPAVYEHLGSLANVLRQRPPDTVRRALAPVAADTLQLAGELLFDADLYVDAGQCYTLAAQLARAADAWDLWGCAITRHALIDLHDQRPADAASLLHTATPIARLGDSGLSTRYWVDTVRAQAFSALGDFEGCERAFAAAQTVHELTGTVHNGGWLRFDGTRLDEEHASCYIRLGRPDRAQELLTPLLERPLSTRRRASVLVDLAAAGAQQRDAVQLVMYGNAAIELAHRTRSGYLARRLEQLQPYIPAHGIDGHVRRLHDQITTLSTALP